MEPMLRVLGLFNPLMREMVEMHYLQTTPVIMDDSALSSLLGSLKKTTYAAARPRGRRPPNAFAVAPSTPIRAPPQNASAAIASVIAAPRSSSGKLTSATPNWNV